MTSYYAPTVPGTVGITEGPVGTPIYTGEQHNIVVACDLGRYLYAFMNGNLVWQKSLSTSWPRALDVFEGMLLYADGQNLVVCNPATGFIHKTYNLGAVINSVKVTRYNGETFVAVCFDTSGVGSVKLYKWADMALTWYFTNPHAAGNPRGAYLFAGWLFVADTFGHRVYAVDVASGGMRNSTEVYYPNGIEPITSDKVLVCAEHENRVFEWDYYPTDSRTMFMSAPVAPYNDISKTKADIVSLESSTGITPGYEPPKSACAKEYAGDVTLYSPNYARVTSSGLLVADTDNHRVVLYRDNSIVTEITGFNNPVNAAIF